MHQKCRKLAKINQIDLLTPLSDLVNVLEVHLHLLSSFLYSQHLRALGLATTRAILRSTDHQFRLSLSRTEPDQYDHCTWHLAGLSLSLPDLNMRPRPARLSQAARGDGDGDRSGSDRESPGI